MKTALTRSLPITAIAAIVAMFAVNIADACSGCGCSSKKSAKKTASSCSSGACSMSTMAKSHKSVHNLTTLQMAAAVQAQNAIILDARSGKYDDGQRIPGARQLSASASESDIKAMLPNKGAAIITYCSNTKCPASKMLADRLVSLGYTNVKEYPQGIAGWIAAGGEVVQASEKVAQVN